MNAKTVTAPLALQDYLLMGARLSMSSLFIFSGLEKLMDFNGAVAFAAFHGVPLPRLLMPVAIAFELGAAAAVMAGWHTRIAAVLLILWTLILGVWFHQFWSSPSSMWQVSIDDFFHHFVMAGGFVFLAVYGPGRMSMDARGDRPR